MVADGVVSSVVADAVTDVVDDAVDDLVDGVADGVADGVVSSVFADTVTDGVEDAADVVAVSALRAYPKVSAPLTSSFPMKKGPVNFDSGFSFSSGTRIPLQNAFPCRLRPSQIQITLPAFEIMRRSFDPQYLQNMASLYG